MAKYILSAAFFLLLLTPIMAQSPEDKLKDLGISLIPPSPPVANYVKVVRTGNLLFLAGHGPAQKDGKTWVGKLGENMTVNEGYEAARYTAIALLSTLKAELGDLDRIVRIVKVNGMVNCTADFIDQSKVINGCSDLLVEVLGDKGKHARAAVGMMSLPNGMPVEIEMVVEVR